MIHPEPVAFGVVAMLRGVGTPFARVSLKVFIPPGNYELRPHPRGFIAVLLP